MLNKMLDISNICRICLKEEDPKLPIFTENDDKSESKPTLPEKIMSFARVKVVKDDGLPMYICVKCYCQVDTTVEFKRLCEESFHFFTQQLDSFSNSRPVSPYSNGRASDSKDDSDGYDTNLGILTRNDDTVCVEPSFKDAVSFSQHWAIPEEPVKAEDYNNPEVVAEDEPTVQVFKITGNDESWIDNGERAPGDAESDQQIKCEPVWDYPSFEFDLSNVKIENGAENVYDEGRSNPLELNPDDFSRSGYDGVLTPSSSIEKTCKCRSCEMVFSNRREMGFHISVAHRRCGTCGKYFFSNKDKDGHKCSDEDKTYPANYVDKLNQCCRICNKTVKYMRSHMAWHRRRKMKVLEQNKDSTPIETIDDSQMDAFTALQSDVENASEDKIKCHLCNVVCSTQKGFKIHMTCMHRDHQIVYACLVCKSRFFLSKLSCENHLIKKHGLLPNGNIQFRFRHVSEYETDDVKGLLKNQINKKKNFNNAIKADSRKVKKLNISSVDCQVEHMKANNFVKKKARAKRMDINRKRPSHPPFSTQIPIITNNFEVTFDANGLKIYICRGCNVNYNRYISAYNHYYTISKRAAKLEQNQLMLDSKPYNCKYCTLKFSSRSQAMMHRIHAHKYFYKKFTLEKKPKNPQGDFAKKNGKSG